MFEEWTSVPRVVEVLQSKMSFTYDKFCVRSAFGHLDGIHATLRSCNNQIVSVSDAHIRFERITEMKPKSSAVVEEVFLIEFIFLFSSFFL